MNDSLETWSCDAETRNSVVLLVLCGHVPSKKNHHFPLANGGLGIDKKVKARMRKLEDDILSALYFSCPTVASATHLECLKQLRTLLSGLCDDSIKEMPSGSWDTEYVPKGCEGVRIEITRLT